MAGEPDGRKSQLRILIIGRYVPGKDGEWRQPLHYFRVLRSRGIEAWLVVLDEVDPGFSLHGLFPGEPDRIYIVGKMQDPKFLGFLRGIFRRRAQQRYADCLHGNPARQAVPTSAAGFASKLRTSAIQLAGFAAWTLLDYGTQWRQRRLVQNLVQEHDISVVHQPVPQCPYQPSFIYGVGAPVVIGPLNGNLSPPPGFRYILGWKKLIWKRVRQWLSVPFHLVLPGKREATILLVSNERTRQGLPPGVRGEVIEFKEGGIDLSLYQSPRANDARADGPIRFVFVGRLVRTKGIDLLLEAFKHASTRIEARLQIIGVGPMLAPLQRLSERLGVVSRVEFTGWLSQEQCVQRLIQSDVQLHASVSEPGGVAVLEAMAMGLPVIAANWGGPADNLDVTCGILIEPTNQQQFIEDLAAAMLKLALSPALRRELGQAGRQRVLQYFDWERKVDRILEIYLRAIRRDPGCEPGIL